MTPATAQKPAHRMFTQRGWLRLSEPLHGWRSPRKRDILTGCYHSERMGTLCTVDVSLITSSSSGSSKCTITESTFICSRKQTAFRGANLTNLCRFQFFLCSVRGCQQVTKYYPVRAAWVESFKGPQLQIFRGPDLGSKRTHQQ